MSTLHQRSMNESKRTKHAGNGNATKAAGAGFFKPAPNATHYSPTASGPRRSADSENGLGRGPGSQGPALTCAARTELRQQQQLALQMRQTCHSVSVAEAFDTRQEVIFGRRRERSTPQRKQQSPSTSDCNRAPIALARHSTGASKVPLADKRRG